MHTLLAKTANLSLLALAALPMIAVSLAHAEPASIKVSDLNMSRPADVRTLDARIDRAAHQICNGDARDLSRVAACREAVRTEAMDKIPANQAQVRVSGSKAG